VMSTIGRNENLSIFCSRKQVIGKRDYFPGPCSGVPVPVRIWDVLGLNDYKSPGTTFLIQSKSHLNKIYTQCIFNSYFLGVV